MNNFFKNIYQINNEENINGKNLFDVISKEDNLLSLKEVESLKENEFKEYHKEFKSQKYFRIKAKSLLWNNVDSYILYVFDETVEHKQQLELQNLLDNVPAGIGIYYFENGVMHQSYLNNTFYSMISDTRENHQKRLNGNFWDGVHPDDVKVVNDEVSKLIKGKDIASFEFRNLCGNGNYLWVKIVTRVIERTSKRITVYASYTDISESIENRKLLEKTNSTIQQQYELEVVRRKNIESRSKATVCFNASKNNLLVFKTDNSVIENNKINISKKINRDEFLKKIYSENDRQKVIDFFTAGNIIDRFSKGIIDNSIEYRINQNDGLVHWVRADSNYVQNPITTDILSYTSFFDVDEEKKNHFATESVVDDEIDYVVLIKIKTNIARLIRINPKFDKPIYHTNFDFSLFIKNKFFDLIIQEDKKALEEFLNKEKLIEQLNKNKAADFTYRIRDNNGNIYRKKARAFYLDETKEDIVFVCRDITDLYKEEQHQREVLQRAVDEANKANQAKSIFLSNMSHDMRTPLNGILGETNLALEEKNLSPNVQKYLNEVLFSGKFLLNLINDVLDMSKIEKGTIEFNPEVYNYEDYISAIRVMLQPLCDAKHIKLIIKDQGAKPNIFVDKMRYQQVYFNILSNAVKYTPNGGTITYYSELNKIDENNIDCKCHIIDNGIGMSEEFQRNLFKPFMRENQAGYTEVQGTGLGLSIANNIVTMMGGDIKIISKLRQGTEVIVHLPLQLANGKENTTVKNDKKDYSILKEKRVLLVEDNKLNSEIAKGLLEKKGVKVECAFNGEECIEKFISSKENYYDLILMDIRMPIMDGLKATKSIRLLQRKDANTIPIIAMTANAFNDDIEKSKKAGMNAHLTKPIEIEKFYSTICEYIK